MGDIGFIIGELIMIVGGGYTALIYSGKLKPNFKNPKDEIKFEEMRQKRKYFVWIGSFLFLFGIFNLIRRFVF